MQHDLIKINLTPCSKDDDQLIRTATLGATSEKGADVHNSSLAGKSHLTSNDKYSVKKSSRRSSSCSQPNNDSSQSVNNLGISMFNEALDATHRKI